MGTTMTIVCKQNFLDDLLKKGPLLKVITGSLTQTISGFTKTKILPTKPFLKSQNEPNSVAVAGLICLEGDKDFSVELFLGFSREIFLSLYQNMFQSQTDEINSENHDLAAEILNIAFGAMDPEFKKLGYNLRSSFPKIYSGPELQAFLKKINSQAIAIPYMSNNQSFTVEIYAANTIGEKWKFEHAS
jgi:CheY-specific phosphatase CheX